MIPDINIEAQSHVSFPATGCPGTKYAARSLARYINGLNDHWESLLTEHYLA